jgi:hypothetical protein
MSMLPPPAPVPAPGAPSPTGSTLIASAWAALKHDKELVLLPVIGGLFALLAAVPVLVAGLLVPTDQSWVLFVIGLVAAIAIAIVSTFFAVALAAGAHDRLGGGSPTVRSAMEVAWRRKKGVIGWALLSVTVGVLLQAIRDRARAVGPIIGFAGDLAWTIASFFAIPIIAANDCGPIEALKLSTKTFKSRWSSAVRVELRLTLYAIGMVVLLAIGLVLAALLAQLVTVLGIVLAVAVVGAFMVAMLVMGALRSYARVALYRYASGLPTPGFASSVLEAAVRQSN